MTVLGLILMVSLIGGQSAPNFGGRWFVDKATVKVSSTRPYWPACGWDCTISHTATELTVTPATGTVKRFSIGGPPATNTIEGFGPSSQRGSSPRVRGILIVVTDVKTTS